MPLVTPRAPHLDVESEVLSEGCPRLRASRAIGCPLVRHPVEQAFRPKAEPRDDFRPSHEAD